ncbi:MAG: hypothetical protein ALECFALPRED_004225 [Alectoria fallacina]|uniref:Uncharacterized protein n=1 Tax=Alectoria fallacina TaxID=1903189 RepID=A0A8H3EM58_9LECA|nr:MAG: hypothetical protein ALECFALPRED_004225 [Alectoria fallacina]
MSSYPSTTQAHPPTTADGSTDAHPAHPDAQSQPLPSFPASSLADIIIGNSFGPYLFKELTNNHPHPQFLGSFPDPALVKLGVPKYLFANRDQVQKLPCSNLLFDTFRYYLCASLARHHAYRTAYLSEGTTPLYRRSYDRFERHFTAALRSTLNDEVKTANNKRNLVRVELNLTHESFHIWPQLFDRTFTANRHLLSSTHSQAPTLLDVLALRDHPKASLQSLRADLQNDWIDLADAADVLHPHDPRYQTWRTLERQKGQLRDRLDIWIAELQHAMDDYDATIAQRSTTWQRQVDRLRDIGITMADEPLRVWDDVVDGLGFRGWKRGLAQRLEEQRESGARMVAERPVVPVQTVWAPWRWRVRAEGKENVRPAGGAEAGAGAEMGEMGSWGFREGWGL